MACCNLLFWVLAEMAAGWSTVKIANRRESVWVLAGLVGIYLAVPASAGSVTGRQGRPLTLERVRRVTI